MIEEQTGLVGELVGSSKLPCIVPQKLIICQGVLVLNIQDNYYYFYVEQKRTPPEDL